VAEPSVGHLPGPILGILVEVLARHTRKPDRCWFCLWEGYGWISGSWIGWLSSSPSVSKRGDPDSLPPAFGPATFSSPRVRLPQRDYLLFGGALDAASDLGRRWKGELVETQSPNLFWADDRTWCVATEIDLDSTFVGGSAALIDDLLRDDRLEAWPALLTDPVWASSDVINR